ncbi:glycoside hydrolase family 128 protein [Cystobasidium minutum MCA 4210]|uniref:glycoside hydrolase family 128 protein n=1 Tax=Cystobasidium minutum MCA 4210 TaxID=1397322 RepID=UPI0034CE5354|eukprot:jgi/Rhomi1/35161/CE35160_131
MTSTKPTTTTARATSTSTSSKKKGVSYNDLKYTKLFGNGIAWAYNWYSAPNGDLTTNVEFTPMLWSNATDLTTIWANNVKAEKARGGTHLLGFNEPDLPGQADMTVAQSVANWKKYMEPYKVDFKLVSPAVTNGGSPMGVAYMKNFIGNCTGCQIDAVALHWYDAAWNTGYFFNYLNDAIKAFAPRPIWLTEFRGSGTAAEQIKFIQTVVPWLEQQPGIERYALFGLFEGTAADGNMITNGVLNEVGVAYAKAL